uniref:Uncharacterized protein n=1 Tax=Tupiella akineta TaxID=160070 RepID=Q6UVR3_TUPAK|nr:hypothetical protein PsakpMp49 [Tupiella akineta]AAQ18761.1 hypothetical protein [Tupiella akineta]
MSKFAPMLQFANAMSKFCAAPCFCCGQNLLIAFADCGGKICSLHSQTAGAKVRKVLVRAWFANEMSKFYVSKSWQAAANLLISFANYGRRVFTESRKAICS